MKVLILASILVFGSALHIRLDKYAAKCSIGGPDYWCKNKETAKRCQVENYCEENVWKHRQVSKPYYDDAVCQECEELVQVIHDKASDESTQSSVVALVTKELCARLPSSYQQMCTAMASIYIKEMMNKVAKETTDGKEFCQQVGFCSGSKKAFRLMQKLRPVFKRLLKSKQVSTDSCTLCEQYVGTIYLLLSNKETKTEILNEVTALCQQYVGGEICSLISSTGGELYDELVKYLATPQKLCQLIGICPKSFKVSADYCTTCEQYVGTVHLLLDNKQTKAQVLNELTNLCKQYAASSGLCPLISSIGGNLYDELVTYLATPKKLCTTLGLCSGLKAVPLVNLQKSKNVIKFANNLVDSSVKVHSVSGEVCEVCTFAITYLDNMLKNTDTQQELKNAVLGICNDLPPSVQGMCTNYVNQYWTAVIGVLISELQDSKAVCTTFHMCSSQTSLSVSLPKNQVIKEDPPVPCLACEFIMGVLDNKLSNKANRQEIEAELDKVCDVAPTSLKNVCVLLIKEYSEVIIKKITDELEHPVALCKIVKLCPSTSTVKKVLKKKTKEVKANPITCEVCQYAMNYLDSMLSDNATEQEVKTALESLCGYLPTSMKGECTSLVDQYTDTILKLIIEEVANPGQICKLLGLCSSSNKGIFKNPIQIKEVKANPITCEVCQYAMNYLDSMLSDNATEQEVKTALESLCGYLPTSMKGQCTSLVDQYTDTILKLIIEEVANPGQICKLLGLCSSAKKVKDDLTCQVCEDALEVLENIVKENKTEEAIKHGLEKICSYLPYISSQCTQLVDEYGDEMLKLLLNEVNPDMVCKAIKLCPSSKIKASVKMVKPEDSITCEFCKYAVTYLDKSLADKRTEESVKEALDKMCSSLPSSVTSQCVSLVNTYSDALIKLLVQELDPSTICQEIKLCTAAVKVMPKKNSKDSVSCELCNFAMGELVKDLKDTATVNEIKVAVKGLCSKMPAHLNDECNLLVNEYFDLIVKVLVTEDITVVCQYIGLCPSLSKTYRGSRKHMLAMRLSLRGVSCEVCQAAMGYLDSVLTEKSTEEVIEKEVESLCDHLPSAIMNECDALITEYGDELIKLIVQKLAPEKVCKALKVC